MKRLLYILSVLFVSLLVSCEKTEEQDDVSKSKPGYIELLNAYDAGKLFKEVQKSDQSSVVVF